MKPACRIVVGLALSMSSATVSHAQDLCAAALLAAPGRACVATPSGVALGRDRAEAERIAAAVREAEPRFLRHFGRRPPRYAILQNPTAVDLRALNASGFGRALPWLTSAEFESAALESIRRNEEVRAKEQGLTSERAAQSVQEAETRWRAANTPEARDAIEAGVLPHEMGHVWYVQLYWPRGWTYRGGHYGGPGPDWFDETAAILMEPDAFAADRRRQFEQVYRSGNPSSGLDEMIDLAGFLRRNHPDSSAPDSHGPAAGARVQVEVREVRAGGASGSRRDLLFYLQARMFADFLIEQTGNPAVFGEIGNAFGAGRTIDRWLAEQGPSNRLPSNVAALDSLWRAWLRSRFGRPGRPAA